MFNPPPPKGGYSEELQAPHVGLAYLAAVLEEHGHKVWVVDSHPLGLEGLNILPLLVRKLKPNLVGITSTTLTINQALKAASLVKGVDPDILVVMGGPHVTFLDLETLASSNAVDAVVRGEGEETLIDLVEKVEAEGNFEGVEGLTYRDEEGKIKREGDRPLIEDLDSLPFPSYRHLPLSAYRSFGLKPPSLPIVTSRGCPFRCSFCVSWKIYRGRWRQRSAKNVVDELEHHVEEYRVTDFSFVDDIFTLNHKRVKEICKEIRERGLEITWGCSARVDTVDEELLKTMKRAGCHTVYFGVEARSQRTLNAMRKGFVPEKVEEVFKLCRKLGINTVASAILFWPTETRKEVKETIRFVKSLEADIAQFCIATPFPGTDLYQEMEQVGLIKEKDWSKYDIVTPVFETSQFNSKYMVRLWKKAYLTFYLRPSYVAKQLAKRSLPLFKAMLHMVKRALYYRLKLPCPEASLRMMVAELSLKEVLP